jgi:D-alanyl-lipoteichoic acid acyltransferase DltB (MBOAT superfamily)
LLLALSLITNLGILGYFKYAYFFTDSFNLLFESKVQVTNWFALWANDLISWFKENAPFTSSFFDEKGFNADKIILPVGISFYTFQTMSYSLDIYRKQLEPARDIFDFAFFVTFFPQLVAGPIVRAKEFIPQLYKPYELNKEDFGWSLYMILKGLIKKIVVADFIAVHFIDRIIHEPTSYPGFISVLAMWGYSMQIYCDFSGYTDIAIGISRLMGFKLNENFNSPYKAVNVAEFWKRWHISLSSFLKDYLYIPIGGNKKASIGSFLWLAMILIFFSVILHQYSSQYFDTQIMWYDFLIYSIIIIAILSLTGKLIPKLGKFLTTDMNLMITMTIGGLWHGNTMNFVIWGALNGFGLVIYKYWKRISPYEKSSFFLVHFWKIFITFNFITFTRIFFRSPDMQTAHNMLNQIWYHFDFDWSVFIKVIAEAYPVVFIILFIAYLIHWLPGYIKNKMQDYFVSMPMPLQAAITSVSVFFIYQAVSTGFQPFIYFQF